MNDVTAGLLGVAAALPISAVAGHFLGRCLKGRSNYTPALYPCVRCDEPDKVRGVLERCGPCEEVVTDIIFDAAPRGKLVRDPLVEMRRNLRSKGL